jgi:hypothetical protein
MAVERIGVPILALVLVAIPVGIAIAAWVAGGAGP